MTRTENIAKLDDVRLLNYRSRRNAAKIREDLIVRVIIFQTDSRERLTNGAFSRKPLSFRGASSRPKALIYFHACKNIMPRRCRRVTLEK